MLMTGADFGGDSREARFELFDTLFSQVPVEALAQTLSADQAVSRQVEVEIAEDAPRCQFTRETFQVGEMASRKTSADDSANRCARNDVGFDSGLGQGLEHTDMRPSTCCATA